MSNEIDVGPLDGEITAVQLPADYSLQLAFLKNLQAQLGDDAALNSLPISQSKDSVFWLPTATEADIRRKLKLPRTEKGNDAWGKKLQLWGAVGVSVVRRDAYFSLLDHRGQTASQVGQQTPEVPTAASVVPKKLSIPYGSDDKGTSRFSTLPKDFRCSPNDWHLGDKGANVVAAWKHFAGAKTLPWRDIRIGHIDTGYTMHTALGWSLGSSTHVLIEEGRDYWRDGDRWEWGKHPNTWFDPYDTGTGSHPGHGTRISATIAGYLDSAEFSGVAPGVCIVPYRVTDSVIVDHVKSLIASAIRDAIGKGCKVINISLGALFGSSELAAALDEAYDSGVIVCCAAGQVWGEVIYPARYNRCITMGGVGLNSKGKVRPWSQAARGKFVDLCAPAENVRRVAAAQPPRENLGTQLVPTPDGDGTSYATAICSGVAALWLARWQDELPKQYKEPWQVPAAFKKLARETATPYGFEPVKDGNGDSLYGSGVLNANALLAKPLPKPAELKRANTANGLFDSAD